MTWVKLDDSFHSHPKPRMAWGLSPASIGLHAFALSYAGNYETNGAVPAWFVESVIPDAAERQSALDALVTSGLWQRVGEGFEIHDFLEFNPSKEQLADKRKRDRDRKANEGR